MSYYPTDDTRDSDPGFPVVASDASTSTDTRGDASTSPPATDSDPQPVANVIGNDDYAGADARHPIVPITPMR